MSFVLLAMCLMMTVGMAADYDTKTMISRGFDDLKSLVSSEASGLHRRIDALELDQRETNQGLAETRDSLKQFVPWDTLKWAIGLGVLVASGIAYLFTHFPSKP